MSCSRKQTPTRTTKKGFEARDKQLPSFTINVREPHNHMLWVQTLWKISSVPRRLLSHFVCKYNLYLLTIGACLPVLTSSVNLRAVLCCLYIGFLFIWDNSFSSKVKMNAVRLLLTLEQLCTPNRTEPQNLSPIAVRPNPTFPQMHRRALRCCKMYHMQQPNACGVFLAKHGQDVQII